MVEPGRRCLDDRYELEQLIAAGGMGQVWRGHDVLLGRPVAVKVLRSEYTGDPTFLARFRAEAHHAAALSHPNIAAVFDYGEVTAQDGTGETLAYLVMELVDGEPLSAVLRRQGHLDTRTTLSVLQQTAFALAEAHRAGLVHRDVKPGNILVRVDGSVKITDFGIAWSAASVPLTRTGQVIGTPQYLSPEQAEGKLATPASDVYALGLVGYECLSGHTAFDGDNAVTIALKQVREQPEPLPAELPAGIRALIDRALAKDPAARLRDGAAFVSAIEDVEAGRPIPPPPVRPRPTGPTTGVPQARRPSGRSRRAAGLVLVPLLALLVGAGIAAVVLQNLTSDSGPQTPAAATQKLATQAGIVLDQKAYLGRPVQDVVDDLTKLGLEVDRQQEVTDTVVAGMVTGIDPAGQELRPGDTVVVSYAARPPYPQGLDDRSSPRSQATVRDDQPSTTTTTTAAPAPTTAGSGSTGGGTTTTTPPATTTAAGSTVPAPVTTTPPPTTEPPTTEPPPTTTAAPSTGG